jgi:hypothetical protein
LSAQRLVVRLLCLRRLMIACGGQGHTQEA